MLTCEHCGHSNTAQSNFCSHCGRPLTHKDPGETTTIVPVILDDGAPAKLSEDDRLAVEELPTGSALLIVKRGGTDERFLLNQDEAVAGRHPSCAVFLDDITVSRHHASFTRSAGNFVLRDLGSLNGTYVNHSLIDAPVTLHTGDEVQIGKFRMTVFVSARGLD